MLRRFSVNFALFTIVLDAVLVAAALTIAWQLRPAMSALPYAKYIPAPLHIPWLVYPAFSFTWVFILLLLSVYDSRRNFRLIDELTSLTIGSAIAAVSMAGMLYLSYRDVSRLLFLTFVLISYGSMLTWRTVARLGFRLHKSKLTHQRKVLIVGAGTVGKKLKQEIENSLEHGLHVVGYLDDDLSGEVTKTSILGSLPDARTVIELNQVDDVVIALPGSAYESMDRLVAELHNLPVKVWVIPDYFHLAMHKAVVEEFAGLPMLDLRAPAVNNYQLMVKRAFDLLITILILPPSLLLMGIFAIAIRLEGPGPLILKQKRVGENGRLFDMYKIRTMVPNADELRQMVVKADELGHPIHKVSDDPRVTRVGHILRRTSLDELPQLFNILKGEMSLVGPRPELPEVVADYEPWQWKRFAVPQGITGWWQVNGRSDRPMHLHTEDDLYYVQNYSLLLDIQILLKTVGVVIQGKGAF